MRVSVSSDLCLSLKSGKCDAFAVDEPIYEKMSRIESDICVLDSNLFNGEVGIGFGLENTAMRDEFNLMLAEMRTNGTYDEILTRWLEQDRPAMPALEMPRVAPPLRVGVASSGAPFDYYEHGQVVGFDPELVMRFGQRLGRQVEFQIINFGGLIAALTSGKVDVVTDMSITEDRAKQVNFSDPYFVNYGVILVLEKNLAKSGGAAALDDCKPLRAYKY